MGDRGDISGYIGEIYACGARGKMCGLAGAYGSLRKPGFCFQPLRSCHSPSGFLGRNFDRKSKVEGLGLVVVV